jgi:hypothetical protein
LDKQNLEKPPRKAFGKAAVRIGTMHLDCTFFGATPDYIGI